MASNQEAGEAAYLISSSWFDGYLRFILYDDFKNDMNEDAIKQKLNVEEHIRDNHPGQINNDKDLCEEDKDCQNVYGTGRMKGYE